MSQYNYKCEVVGCMPEYPFLNDRHRADARLTVNLYKDSKESMDYMINGVGLLVEVNVRHAKDESYISDMQHQPLPVIEIDLLGSGFGGYFEHVVSSQSLQRFGTGDDFGDSVR